ncbi:MAG: hypothetical protein OXM02_03590 [Bacteroidota bacterium]|nr:hypothetical protein [Bacteroidota bacterium]MDE2833583.1 hypothetical protein [Bacteroidota bacterium]
MTIEGPLTDTPQRISTMLVAELENEIRPHMNWHRSDQTEELRSLSQRWHDSR